MQSETIAVPNAISLSDTVARRPGRLHREVEGRVVLMSLESGDIFELNALARQIWFAIEQPVAVSGLCEQLATQTGASAETVRRDTLTFLDQLAQHRLVTVV